MSKITYNINDIKSRLKVQDEVLIPEYKFLLEKVHHDLQNETTYDQALELLCLACEDLPKDELLITLASDCISESRIFLYSDMLEKRGVRVPIDGHIDIARKAFYTLPTMTTLAKPQREIYKQFLKHRRLVVSAPTSFGKTKLFFEIITTIPYGKIAVVMPTNALIYETYSNIRKSSFLRKYRIITSTRTTPNPDDNEIYLFTPEKMDIYLDDNPELVFDFFLYDEIYKIDNEDDREIVFTNVLYRLLSMSTDFYLIGPFFDNFSESVLRKTHALFIKVTTNIVQKEVYNYFDASVEINNSNLGFAKSKDVRLKRVLNCLQSQSLVYTSRKNQAESVANKMRLIFGDKQPSARVEELIDYISKHISDKWSLIDCLKAGVAFHHAGVPKYIGNEIVDLFNDKQLIAIASTSTLTEGINTSAKNVILYDNKKGAGSLITGFEAKNIAGRAGRFGEHFIGRIINLEEPVSESDIDTIDFSFFDDDELSLEQSMLVKEKDLSSKQLCKRSMLEQVILNENISLNVLRRNKYINIDNQIRLIRYLRDSKYISDNIFFNTEIPNKEIFGSIFNLVHEFLFNIKDKNDQKWTPGQLERVSKFYLYRQPSIKELIQDDEYGKKVDTKVRHVLDLVYHYFEFALPKYISAFENIYNYVFPTSTINLQYVTKLFQYGSKSNEEIILYETGIPKELAQKLARYLHDCKDLSDVRSQLQGNRRAMLGLHPFEKTLINKLIE
jgi:helicase